MTKETEEAIQKAIIAGYRGFLEACNVPQPNQALVEMEIKNSIVLRENDMMKTFTCELNKIKDRLKVLEGESMTFYGMVDSTTTIKPKEFSITGEDITVDGIRIKNVFRIQMDCQKAKRVYIIDSYGDHIICGDRLYVSRLIVNY